MPADQPGRTQAGTKARRRTRAQPRPRPKPKPNPWKGAGHVGTGYTPGPKKAAPNTGQPKTKTPRFRPDDKSDAERLRVEKFKATPRYRQTLRDVYDVKSVVRRRARAGWTTRPDYEPRGRIRLEAVATPRPTLEIRHRRPRSEKMPLLRSTTMESAILQNLHRQRVARNRELARARAQHDVTTAGEWRDVTRTLGSGQYGRILKEAATARQYHGNEREQAREAQRILTSGIEFSRKAKKEAAAQDPKTIEFNRKVQSTALEGMDYVNRLLLGVTGGAYAGLHGRNVLTGVARGFTGKEKHYGSDVIDAMGIHNKVAKGILGFGVDVVADPLTYLSLGTYKPAKEAAELAMRESLRESAKEAERLGLQHGTQAARDFENGARAKAVRAAQEAHDAHPQAGATGITVGVRAKVPFSSRLRFEARSRRLGEVTARATKTVQGIRGRRGPLMRVRPEGGVDEAMGEAWHSWRPRGVHPVLWDEYRRIALTARGSLDAGQRAAKLIARDIRSAVRKYDLDDEAQIRIAKAIDEGPEAVAALPEGGEREVADRIVEVFDRAEREEVARNLRGPGIGHRERPEVPEPTFDMPTLRKEAARAERRAAAAEANVARLEAKVEHAQGRAEILSRNVEGTRAGERAAERGEHYAGGAHGVNAAREARDLARARAADLRAEAIVARKAVRDAQAPAAREAKVIREAERAAQRFDEGAGGYFARIRRQDFDETSTGYRKPPSSRGRLVDDPSLHQRTAWRPLSQMDPDDALQTYILEDLGFVVGQRMGAHARMVALSDMQRRTGALVGKPITKIEDIDKLGGLEGYRLYRRDRKGYHDLLGEDQLNLEKVERALADGKDLYLMPKRDIDLVYELAGRGRSGRMAGDSAMARGFDYLQGLVKTTQTVVNPGYHVTNLLGDLYNAQIAGTSGVSVLRAAQLLRQAQREDRRMRHAILKDFDDMPVDQRGRVEHYEGLGRKASDAEVVMLAQRHGGLGMGHGAAELVQLAQAGEDLSTFGEAFAHYRRGNLIRGFKTQTRAEMDWIRRFNERREDLVRMATFHSALKKGMDPEEAARWVNRHHFDYGDLTESERQVARRLIPFYMFFARNTRLQVESLGRAPGVLSHYASLREEADEWTPLPDGWAQMLREYQQRGVPMAIPDVAGVGHGQPLLVYPKLPLTDLNQLPSPTHPLDWPGAVGRDLLSRASMFVKMPLELLTGLNLFFRDKDKKHVPAPSWAKYLPQDVKDVVGVQEGYATKTGYTMYWSSWFDKFMRVVPATNLGANLGSAEAARHPGGRALPLISYFAGPKVNTLGGTGKTARTIMGEVGIANLYERYNEIQEQLDDPVNKGDRKGPNRTGPAWRRKRLKSEGSKILQEIWRLDRDMGVPKASRRGNEPKGSGKGNRPKVLVTGSTSFYGSGSGKLYGG